MAGKCEAFPGHFPLPQHQFSRDARYTVHIMMSGIGGQFIDPSTVVTHFHLREGDRVADFGAGSGSYLPALSRAVGATGRVYACEIQKVLVEKLGGLIREKHLLRRHKEHISPTAFLMVDFFLIHCFNWRTDKLRLLRLRELCVLEERCLLSTGQIHLAVWGRRQAQLYTKTKQGVFLRHMDSPSSVRCQQANIIMGL